MYFTWFDILFGQFCFNKTMQKTKVIGFIVIEAE